MKRDIAQTIARFEAAGSVDVQAKIINWLEYELYVAALKALQREVETLNLQGDLRQTYQSLWTLRRIIRTHPIDPLVAYGVTPIGTSRAAGEFGEVLDRALDALDSLLQTANPLTTELVQHLLNDTQLSKREDVSVQVLINQRWRSLCRLEFGNDYPGYRVQFVTTTEAKNSPIADVMYVFGDPEEHAFSYEDWDARTRKISWLFNAPSAKRVVCLLLQDTRSTNFERFQVWSGADQFDPKIRGRLSGIDLRADYVPPKFDDPVLPHVEVGEQIVDAFRCRLADGSCVYFMKDGLKVRVLERDDFNVEVTEIEPAKIRRGTVILVNASEASRSFINEEANRQLRKQFNDDEILKFRSVVAAYKRGLMEYPNLDELVRKAVALGLEEGYVKNHVRRMALRETFGPQMRDRFEVMCGIIGLPVTDGDWLAVSTLQAANRRAGVVAKERLCEIIENDATIFEFVLEPQLVTKVDPEFGAIAVSAIVEDPILVSGIGVSKLNQIIEQQAEG